MAEYTAAVTSVAASISAVTLFAAQDAIRQGNALNRMIYNDSTATLYVKYGASASAADCTVQVPAGGYYELPAPVYDGLVTGVWASANGAARCTEVTV